MKKIFQTEAIVLRKKPLLEKDFLVVLFTQDKGKKTVFAKGAKKLTSKRLPHLDTGNLIKVLINFDNEKAYLQQTELISYFSQIKKDKNKINFFYQFFFVLEKILPENQEEKEVYLLTKKFLIELSKKYHSQLIFKYLNLLLKKLGYLKKELSEDNLRLFINELIDEKLPLFII